MDNESQEKIIAVFDALYKEYTPNEIGQALAEYRRREGFWKPEEKKPKTRATKKAPEGADDLSQ
jgi:hypothetical protein